MRLSKTELLAMNNPLRRLAQGHFELPAFKALGLECSGRDILEIGCGCGYGAELLMRERPRSYFGIDLMPEQITFARRREIAGTTFAEMDATDLGAFEDDSKDLVIIFGILHHIDEWRQVVAECRRVLRPDGAIFVEEPDATLVRPLAWLLETPNSEAARFSLCALEEGLAENGFAVLQRKKRFGLGFYHAKKTAASVGN